MTTTAANTPVFTALRPWTILAFTMFLVAAVGVPGELVLQDTLKSAWVVFGTLTAAIVFLWRARRVETPLVWHGLVWLPLALAASALASTVWSHTYLATVEMVRWAVFSLLLWLGLNTLTQANARQVVAGIHAGAVAAAVWAGLQFWFDLRLFPQGASPASTFINRNFFAEYAVCALPFSVLALLGSRPGKWPWINALGVACVILAILMTGTRSALLALGLQLPLLAALALLNRRQLAAGQWGARRALAVALLLLVTIGGLGSLPTGNPTIQQEGAGSTAWQRGWNRTASVAQADEYSTGSFSVRASMWKATWRMVAAQPWSGVGAGAWEVTIPLYQGQEGSTGLETDYYAHNEILQLLAEYGVVVGGLFVAILLAYGLQAVARTWRLPPHQRHEAPLRWFALASLLALLVVSNAGFPWRLATTGAIFALCLGLLAASDTRLGTSEGLHATQRRAGPRTFRWLLVAGLCAGAVATLVTVQALRAESKLVGAIHRSRAPTNGAPSTPALAAARKAEMLELTREGIALNPHYRKLTAIIGDRLAANGDWENALWVWESVAASRPNVAALQASIVLTNMRLGRHAQALAALPALARLEPGSSRVRALNALLLARTGQAARATSLLNGFFDREDFDADLLQVGYAVGLETQDWALAVRSLELRIKLVPALAVDAHVRLGAIYSDARVHNDAQALQAYRAAYALVAPQEKENLRSQVPERYRAQLD